MKKLKVAIVTPGTFAMPSAKNSSVEKVVEHVCEQLQDQVNFSLFSKREGRLPAVEQRGGITYIRPDRHKKGMYLSSVNNWLKKIAPDLIQVENRPRMISYFRKYHPIPLWLNLHSTRFITPPHISPLELSRHMEFADRIVVNSHYLKEQVTRIVPRARKKIRVNHLGVDPERFISRWTPEGEGLRQAQMDRLGYTGKKIILYAGRLIEQKGIHFILEAMPEIVAAFPEAVLVIVGSAYYGRDELTPYVTHLHQLGNRLPQNVLFVPFQPYQRMADWFRLADVTIVPSFQDEAFGLVNVEAMACGSPVLAANVGGMREIIMDGQSGFLLDPHRLQGEIKDAVILLFSNDELRISMGQAAAAHARKSFTWQHTALRWLRLYLQK